MVFVGQAPESYDRLREYQSCLFRELCRAAHIENVVFSKWTAKEGISLPVYTSNCRKTGYMCPLVDF